MAAIYRVYKKRHKSKRTRKKKEQQDDNTVHVQMRYALARCSVETLSPESGKLVATLARFPELIKAGVLSEEYLGF